MIKKKPGESKPVQLLQIVIAISVTIDLEEEDDLDEGKQK